MSVRYATRIHVGDIVEIVPYRGLYHEITRMEDDRYGRFSGPKIWVRLWASLPDECLSDQALRQKEFMQDGREEYTRLVDIRLPSPLALLAVEGK